MKNLIAHYSILYIRLLLRIQYKLKFTCMIGELTSFLFLWQIFNNNVSTLTGSCDISTTIIHYNLKKHIIILRNTSPELVGQIKARG